MVKFGEELARSRALNAEDIAPDKYIAYEKLKETLYEEPSNFLPMFEEELFRIRDVIKECTPEDSDLFRCSVGDGLMCECAVKRRADRTARVYDALSHFVKMNREGFRKIVKKYDKVNNKQESAPRTRMVAVVLSDPIEELELLLGGEDHDENSGIAY